MANSPSVSIRIPPETLKRIDRMAQKLYPSRQAGKHPNRSQLILQAIEQFLEEQESSCDNNLEKELDGAGTAPHEHQTEEQAIIQTFKQSPQYIEPPIREYINWWFDYFSYMKNLTDVWFSAK
jgi:metal-responsive CopG/Arc/MetJ family transcriptional regulator